MIRVSDFVVKFIEKKGIKDVFVIPGGGCMHLAVSLFRSNINSISTHHEMACTLGAEAYARVKNDLAAVLLTTGPGVSHGLSGVAEAFIGATPVLIISGQSKYNQTVAYNNLEGLRQVGVQEINAVELVKSITKYAVMVTEPNEILYHLQKACYIAKSGRPGPVWLDIPIDIQAAEVDESTLNEFKPNEAEKIHINPNLAEEIAEIVKNSKRPLIIAGNGVRISGGIGGLKKIAEKYKIPVVTTLMGIDVLHTNHPNNIGNIGHKGNRFANIALQRADVVISVGSRLTTAATGYAYDLFADKARKIVVDIDEVEHKKKTITYDTFVHGDAKEFLQLLSDKLDLCGAGTFESWLKDCADIKEKYAVMKEVKTAEHDDGLNLYHVIDMITKKIAPGDVIIGDVGSAMYTPMQAATVKESQRMIISGLAAMGYSLPAATGASFANNKGKVVAFTGDGSFQQNVQELMTISHYELPIKIILINNDGYFSMREVVQRGNNTGIMYDHLKKNLSFPNYKLLAEACGLDYCKIEKLSDFCGGSFAEIMDSDRPALINVKTSNSLNIFSVLNYHNPDGSFRISPLEDMYPYLEENELKDIMGDHFHPRS